MEDTGRDGAEIVKDAERVVEKLKEHKLCDSCLGRLFSKLGHGLDNGSRGRMVRAHFDWSEKEDCEVCGGLIKEIPKFSKLALSRLEPYEFGGARDRNTQPMVDALVANLIERTS